MPISKTTTTIVGIAVVGTLIVLTFLVSRPIGPAVSNVQFESLKISPNADGNSDITTISYQVWRDVRLTIYFVNSAGQRFYFRRDEMRTWGEYSVFFSGIVEGFVLENETFKGNILTRLMPDGDYEWVFEAFDVMTGKTEQTIGSLTVSDSDSIVPDIQEFTISPETFTPNQDGLDDRVWINTFLPKPAQMVVYLIDSNGKQYFVPESQQSRVPGEEGRHSFEYEGGVDLGISPPADGTYTVLVESKDDEGQRVQASGQVTIKDGGVPLAEIVAQPVGDTLIVNSETIRIGELLSFTVTVENYGDAPIRTTGPAPAFTYEQNQTYPSTGFFQESGAWRIGINCDTCLTDYPWRWALGTAQTLTAIVASDGRTHYYLMPGQRAVITGSIRLTDIVPSRNPQQFWVGLIHEDVGIAPLNNRVDPHWIEIFTDEPFLAPTANP